MEANSDLKKKFLDVLENSLSPFEKFVAKSDIEETLPLVSNRKYLVRQIVQNLNKHDGPQIFPMMAETGTGKTFILWQIKKSLEIQSHAVFMNVPTSSRIFNYDLYTKIIEEIGATRLREITTTLADKWGAGEVKYGLFRINDSNKVLRKAKETVRFRWNKNQTEMEEVIKVIIAHAMDPELSTLAEQWLLGKSLDPEELYYLGVEHNLSHGSIAHELLSIIFDYLSEGIIIMFDDIDKNWTRYSTDPNLDEDWTQSHSENLQEGKENLQDNGFFGRIAELVRKNREVKIIMTFHPENGEVITQFLERFREYSVHALILNNYSTQDSKEYFLEAFSQYRQKHHLLEIPNNPFFPLSKKVILYAFEKTGGNPRNLIKEFSRILDLLIFDELEIDEIEKKLRNEIYRT